MTDLALIAAVSIFTAGLTVSFGALGPALGEGRAAAAAISAIAQQPDAAPTSARDAVRKRQPISLSEVADLPLHPGFAASWQQLLAVTATIPLRVP